MSCCCTFPIVVSYNYGISVQHNARTHARAHTHTHTHTHTHRAHTSFCVLNFLLVADKPNLAEWKVERACCRASLSSLQCVSFVAVPTTADSAAAVGTMIKKKPVCASAAFVWDVLQFCGLLCLEKWNITATGVSGCVRVLSCIHETWNRKQVENWGMTDWQMSGGATCRCPKNTQECYSWWASWNKQLFIFKKVCDINQSHIARCIPYLCEWPISVSGLYSRAWRRVVR